MVDDTDMVGMTASATISAFDLFFGILLGVGDLRQSSSGGVELAEESLSKIARVAIRKDPLLSPISYS